MTKLKCWRKTGKFEWKNNSTGEQANIGENLNIKPKHNAMVRERPDKDGISKLVFDKNFTTEKQALSKINRYMKSHDKC